MVGRLGLDNAGDMGWLAASGGEDGISVGVYPGLSSLSSGESMALSEKADVS